MYPYNGHIADIFGSCCYSQGEPCHPTFIPQLVFHKCSVGWLFASLIVAESGQVLVYILGIIPNESKRGDKCGGARSPPGRVRKGKGPERRAATAAASRQLSLVDETWEVSHPLAPANPTHSLSAGSALAVDEGPQATVVEAVPLAQVHHIELAGRPARQSRCTEVEPARQSLPSQGCARKSLQAVCVFRCG